MCPLQRDRGCDRGRLELRWGEDDDAKLLRKPADPVDGILVRFKSSGCPAVRNVDHAHAFQKEEAQVMLTCAKFTPEDGPHSTSLADEIGDFFDRGIGESCLIPQPGVERVSDLLETMVVHRSTRDNMTCAQRKSRGGKDALVVGSGWVVM